MPTIDDVIYEYLTETPDEKKTDAETWKMDDPDKDVADSIEAMDEEFEDPDVPPVDMA